MSDGTWDTDGPEVSDHDLELLKRSIEEAAASAGLDLSEAALWEEPSGDIEATVLSTVTSEPEQTEPPSRPARLRWASVAAVAALVVGAVLATLALQADPPDWEVALGATEAAPGARGAALGWNETSGTRIELELAGLAPPPPEHVYELWFSRGGVHISAGTFRDPAEVVLWAGVWRSDFPRIWITLEPIDADPAPAVNILDTESA